MGGSEARTVTWSSDPKSAPDPNDELRKKQELDALTMRVFGKPEPAREVWQGKGYELARKVRDDLRKAGKSMDELTSAFQQACERYVQKNGRRFTPKSLREGLRQWDDKQTGHLRGR